MQVGCPFFLKDTVLVCSLHYYPPWPLLEGLFRGFGLLLGIHPNQGVQEGRGGFSHVSFVFLTQPQPQVCSFVLFSPHYRTRFSSRALSYPVPYERVSTHAVLTIESWDRMPMSSSRKSCLDGHLGMYVFTRFCVAIRSGGTIRRRLLSVWHGLLYL